MAAVAENGFLQIMRGLIPPWRAPVAPSGFIPDVAAQDTEPQKMLDEGDVFEDTIGGTFAIHYRDVTGAETRRRITFINIQMNGSNFLIGARCHERQAWRCFRADRILEFIDLRSGEVIGSATDWCAGLVRRDGPMAILEACETDVILLAGLARCDGQFHIAESEVMVAHTLDTVGGVGVDLKAMMIAADAVYPSPEHIAKALRKARRYDAGDKRRLLRSASRLAEADGNLVEVEFDMLREFQQALERKSRD